MDTSNSHHIGEQNTAYRRGMVLGLTMAEVGILIIFVLLLLIGFGEWLRQKQARAMEGHVVVEVEHLRALEEADSLLSLLREPLQAADNATADEIHRLIRSLQEVMATPEGQSTLQETRAALDQMRHIRDQIMKQTGAEALAKQVEQQSYQIANKEGQLQHYESVLNEAGLGKGERPCWVKPDGTIEYLYDVVLTSNGIRMREYRYENRESERSLLPMPAVDPLEVLSPSEFLQRTEPLFKHSLATNCRFFVVVYDATGPTEKELYKQLLRTVEGHFYKRLDRGPAPF